MDVTGGISLFTPPDAGADTTPLYKIEVAYWFVKRASANLSLGYATYRADAGRFYYVPTKLRAVCHPPANRLLDPYFGGGLVYSKKKVEASGWANRLGYSGLVGFNLLILSRTTVGATGEYVVPDWRDTDGYWEYGFNFSGITF